MQCENCGSNFRTLGILKGYPHKCYKCGFDNIKECDCYRDEVVK